MENGEKLNFRTLFVKMLDICILASFLLKQIFKIDIGHDFPTSLYGSVCFALVP